MEVVFKIKTQFCSIQVNLFTNKYNCDHSVIVDGCGLGFGIKPKKMQKYDKLPFGERHMMMTAIIYNRAANNACN